MKKTICNMKNNIRNMKNTIQMMNTVMMIIVNLTIILAIGTVVRLTIQKSKLRLLKPFQVSHLPLCFPKELKPLLSFDKSLCSRVE